jgi:hypothetical protein
VSARTFRVGNCLWWFGALLLGPVVGALAGSALVAGVATALLLLPVFVLFDTDRPWWSDDVRALPGDIPWSRTHTRWLSLSAGLGLLGGLLLALFRPWA